MARLTLALAGLAEFPQNSTKLSARGPDEVMRPQLSWIERCPPKVEATRANRVGRAISSLPRLGGLGFEPFARSKCP